MDNFNRHFRNITCRCENLEPKLKVYREQEIDRNFVWKSLMSNNNKTKKQRKHRVFIEEFSTQWFEKEFVKILLHSKSKRLRKQSKDSLVLWHSSLQQISGRKVKIFRYNATEYQFQSSTISWEFSSFNRSSLEKTAELSLSSPEQEFSQIFVSSRGKWRS